MIGYSVSSAKNLFFDNPLIKQSVDYATRKNLSQFGAFVRSDARRSIRKKRGHSQPPKPPHSHTGKLKRFVYFVYEQKRRTVIIGPARFAGARPDNLVMLEAGGHRMGNIPTREGGMTKVKQTYKKRPFMKPAFDKNLPKGMAMWKDSVRQMQATVRQRKAKRKLRAAMKG